MPIDSISYIIFVLQENALQRKKMYDDYRSKLEEKYQTELYIDKCSNDEIITYNNLRAECRQSFNVLDEFKSKLWN